MKSSANKPKNKQTSTDSFPMAGVDVEQLERLLEFMASHGLEEFEYEHAGLHIRLRKAPAGYPAAGGAPSRVPEDQAASSWPSAAGSVQTTGTGDSASSSSASAAPHAEELHTIKSPIVGTFYEAPSPDAPPFVKVGDAIQEGKVVCIVEAMKLMNEIEADASGDLVRVLVENGQPVEYGQPLFAIRPTHSKTPAKKK
jgi:acetyl-CoA carboxylase biotin carboxyl carrier protein